MKMGKVRLSGIVALTKILIKIGPKLSSTLLELLKGGKAAKLILFGTSAVSYAALFGWKVAVMILVSLFFHESGHIWAMKQRKMKTKGIYFLPFIGAAAVPDEEFPSREAENYSALMGPTVGLALSGIAYLMFLLTNDLEFAAAAGWMSLVNLLNLLPILPLDGGRVLRSIAFSFNSWIGIGAVAVGMFVGAAIAARMALWLFVILIPLGVLEVLLDFKEEKEREKELERIKAKLEIVEQKGDEWSWFKKYYKERIKELTILPKMSKGQIAKSIAWTLILLMSLFFILQQAAIITGSYSFFEILK
jgi:Zn-dependent protease